MVSTLRALIAFGFENLRLERICFDVYDFNARARHVRARRLRRGKASSRHALYRDGVFHDDHRMAILREEWAAGRPQP
jgi:RimJ/RimL family protein N-acetyltransferase